MKLMSMGEACNASSNALNTVGEGRSQNEQKTFSPHLSYNSFEAQFSKHRCLYIITMKKRNCHMMKIKVIHVVLILCFALLISGCQSSQATQEQSNPLGNVDWSKVITPTTLGCIGDHPSVTVDEKQFADVTGDGKAEAFVAVACTAQTSSWPDRLEVFDGASSATAPRLMTTLLDYQDGTDQRGLRMGKDVGLPQSISISGAKVTVVSYSYAARDANCCFSQRVTDTFTWNGKGFTRGQRSIDKK
jgi:hypothetical protein